MAWPTTPGNSPIARCSTIRTWNRSPARPASLFRALGRRACLVVTDDYPDRAAGGADGRPAEPTVRIEKIDGNGLLPMRAADRAFSTAHAFRRFLQATLREYLFDAPQPNPLARRRLPRLESLPAEIVRRWPAVDGSVARRRFRPGRAADRSPRGAGRTPRRPGGGRQGMEELPGHEARPLLRRSQSARGGRHAAGYRPTCISATFPSTRFFAI